MIAPFFNELASDAGFFIAVDVKHNHVNIGLSDLQKQVIKIVKHVDYRLENLPSGLDEGAVASARTTHVSRMSPAQK